ncbi:MAG TPA: PIG-L family deacetylase [bacterium]|nr:PIG-L family deacetylase [bacterium]HOL34886.1 PIG-L family deacetylase [bacterium]HPP08574.1 PIG-L family deacetylase [bacterium]
MERILAFGCHPDDIEFMCAGTLALLVKKGFEIHLATMTGGEVGHPFLAAHEIRNIRLKENENSAKIIGGFFHYAGGSDLEVEYNDFYRRASVRIIRKVDPLIVFTTFPFDYLIDHKETSRLVRNACYIASVPNYDKEPGLKPTNRFPYLYYWNASGLKDIFGNELPLTCIVDISSTINIKEEMLACHKSQMEWLKYHNKWENYLEIMKRQSRKEGEKIGVEFAEGFIQHKGNGHPQDNILKQILGELCQEIK